jgi:glutathione S-transferase
MDKANRRKFRAVEIKKEALMAIRLFQFKTSMFCEKARIVLSMKNLPYEPVDARQDERKALIEFSGQKKVPVLDYHGQCVTDSTTIAAFLDEKHPQNGIYPTDPSQKALCLILEDWADEVLFKAVHDMRPAESAETKKKGEEALQVHLRNLDRFLDGRKFVFDRLTMADIAIFVELHYLYTTVQYAIPAEYRNVAAWMDLMRGTLKLSSLQDIAA